MVAPVVALVLIAVCVVFVIRRSCYLEGIATALAALGLISGSLGVNRMLNETADWNAAIYGLLGILGLYACANVLLQNRKP